MKTLGKKELNDADWSMRNNPTQSVQLIPTLKTSQHITKIHKASSLKQQNRLSQVTKRGREPIQKKPPYILSGVIMEAHGGCVTAGNSTSAFEEDELEVEDEDDEEQRQQRIQSLQNQDLFWRACKVKSTGRAVLKTKGIPQYALLPWREFTRETFAIFFVKFGGLKRPAEYDIPRHISTVDINTNSPRVMEIKLAQARRPQQQGQAQSSSFRNNYYDEEQKQVDDEYETPGEDHGIDQHMKFHSLEKAKQSAIHFKSFSNNSAPDKAGGSKSMNKQQQPYYDVSQFDTPDDQETPLDGDFGLADNPENERANKIYAEQQLFRKKEAEAIQREMEMQQQQQDNQKLVEQKQLGKNIDKDRNNSQGENGKQLDLKKGQGKDQESSVDQDALRSKMQQKLLEQKLIEQQQSAMKQQQQLKLQQQQQQQLREQQLQQQKQQQILQQQQQQQQPDNSSGVKARGLESNVAAGESQLQLGQDELTAEQKEYFSSDDFKYLVKKEILNDLKPEKDPYDNEDYIIISKDIKWSRLYLKKVNLYIQCRVFTSIEQFSGYLEGYDKIVQRFTLFMPQTIFSDKHSLTVIQKLGDFSLYDLSNLLLIESKSRPNANYEKNFSQLLSSLMQSLLVILSGNYYIGNISPRNVFVAKTTKAYVLKFSNLVDFSFDYATICDKNYASVEKPKPSDSEIWFSELYACCRCMQEMMERDKYYLQKKNIREFNTRYKGKYPKIAGILQYFLLKGEQPQKTALNIDQICAYLSSNVENSLGIGLSERSVKHIQNMIKSSRLHLREEAIELDNTENQQRLFFFVQQLHFHQDFADDEIKYMIKFLNRTLYCQVLQRAGEEESDLLYAVLETILTDASVFRRDKHLQRSTYAVYIMYQLRSEPRIDKSMAYWRYMSQTTSLVESSNPISLYYVGLFNMLMLDGPKSAKYFAFATDSAEFEEDLVPSQDKTLRRFQTNNNRYYDDYYDDEDYGKGSDWRKGKKRVSLPPNMKLRSQSNPAIRKKKGSHALFTGFQEADNTILLIREAYGVLAEIKYAFLQETSVKKIEQILKEAKMKSVHKALAKVIELELAISASLKYSIVSKIKARMENMFFVDQVATAPGFAINAFAAISKTVSNQITLTDNFKRQCGPSDPLLQAVSNVLSAHAQLQAQIVDAVSFEKRILNYSPDKYKGNILSYFNQQGGYY